MCDKGMKVMVNRMENLIKLGVLGFVRKTDDVRHNVPAPQFPIGVPARSRYMCEIYSLCVRVFNVTQLLIMEVYKEPELESEAGSLIE